MLVKVSAKSARLMFHPCEPDYIKNVCKGVCCDSPKGAKTFVLKAEIGPIVALGATVEGGVIQPRADKKCPFKTDEHLCAIHVSGEKPLACHVTPFTLNTNNTMILTNRHKKLPCFKDEGAVPAYVSYRNSLDLIFGKEISASLCAHLDKGGGDITLPISDDMVNFLISKRDAFKVANNLAVRVQKPSKNGPKQEELFP